VERERDRGEPGRRRIHDRDPVRDAGAHDGYTLLASETGFYTTQPHLYGIDQLGYDAEKDFVPVAGYGTIPTALLVNPSLPVNSVSDLIALAKKKPGALTFGTAGIGTALHVAGLELENLAGIDITAVHYRGSAPALTDVIAGHIDAVIWAHPWR
jgi:tripartite-type tricarboxylate transporter receptor subunit TctC